MVRYLVLQMRQKKLKYSDVIKNFPNLKDSIDEMLKENGIYDEVIAE